MSRISLFNEIIISVNDEQHKNILYKVLAKYLTLDILRRTRIIIDEDLGIPNSPLLGLCSAIIKAEYTEAFVAACDMSFLSAETTLKVLLLLSDKECEAVVPIWSNAYIEP